MQLHSYPKVYALGHRAIQDLLDGEIVVQEKVDGSQFSFGVVDGRLHCRSRGGPIDTSGPQSLFAPAVATALRLSEEGKLGEGWTYRGEALCKPKHNTLAYGRAPEGGVILFDVDTGLENRLGPNDLKIVADCLELEVVPLIYRGPGSAVNMETLKGWLERESILGSAKVEGVVIKNYSRFNQEDGKQLMGKYVSEAFKEVHRGDWKVRNPGRADVVDAIVTSYATERRWEKAVERMRDEGRLLGDPRDIGPLMGEVAKDVLAECEDEIRDVLFKHFWKSIGRGVARGLPEWYKQRLAAQQFEPSEALEAAGV